MTRQIPLPHGRDEDEHVIEFPNDESGIVVLSDAPTGTWIPAGGVRPQALGLPDNVLQALHGSVRELLRISKWIDARIVELSRGDPAATRRPEAGAEQVAKFGIAPDQSSAEPTRQGIYYSGKEVEVFLGDDISVHVRRRGERGWRALDVPGPAIRTLREATTGLIYTTKKKDQEHERLLREQGILRDDDALGGSQ